MGIDPTLDVRLTADALAGYLTSVADHLDYSPLGKPEVSVLDLICPGGRVIAIPGSDPLTEPCYIEIVSELTVPPPQAWRESNPGRPRPRP